MALVPNNISIIFLAFLPPYYAILVTWGCITDGFFKIESGSLFEMPKNVVFWPFKGIFGHMISWNDSSKKSKWAIFILKWVTFQNFRLILPKFGAPIVTSRPVWSLDSIHFWDFKSCGYAGCYTIKDKYETPTTSIERPSIWYIGTFEMQVGLWCPDFVLRGVRFSIYGENCRKPVPKSPFLST